MNCYVYKGAKKEGHYLFLPHKCESNSLPDNFPQALSELLGELSFVLEFELTKDRKLMQADVKQVKQDLIDHGFYLQMPKEDLAALEAQYFN